MAKKFYQLGANDEVTQPADLPTKLSQLTNDSGFVTADHHDDSKADEADLTAHTGNSDIHVTATDKTTWSGKQDALTFDQVPTSESSNPVKSGGVFTWVKGLLPSWFDSTFEKPYTKDEVDTAISEHHDTTKAEASDLTTHTGNSTIHVTAADKTTWSGKQDALTFDDVPTESSTKIVKSGGIFTWVKGLLPSWFDSSFAKPYTKGEVDTAISSHHDSTKADSSDLSAHTGDATIHVTSADKTTWSSKQDAITASGILKGDGLGGITAAVASDIPGLSDKASKVTPSAEGNLAGLDASGNLTDSGKKATDFLPSSTSIPTKTSDLTNDGSDGTNAFVSTNDTRLSDSRTPVSHASSHASTGSDPISPSSIGAITQQDLDAAKPYAKIAKNSGDTLESGAINVYSPSSSETTATFTLQDVQSGKTTDLLMIVDCTNAAPAITVNGPSGKTVTWLDGATAMTYEVGNIYLRSYTSFEGPTSGSMYVMFFEREVTVRS